VTYRKAPDNRRCAICHDPEGSNLLVTGIVAIVVFIPLWLIYRVLTKKH
jgi:hypothetical protein